VNGAPSRKFPRLCLNGVWHLAVAGLLPLYAAWRISLSWRYFDRFMWDDGWYFQVSRRVAEGEVLYRDVAWDYGPLPVLALGWLLRIEPTVLWFHLLDFLLILAGLLAVYLIARDVASRPVALLVTVWAGLLGGAGGLISHQLAAYTTAVAWGTSTSLLAVWAACRWARTRRGGFLVLTLIFTIGALLSKPEYGLAGLVVLATAVLVAPPGRHLLYLLMGIVALAVGTSLVAVTPATLGAFWRGYTGYDLIREGSIPVLNSQALLGSLLVSALTGASLWSLSRVRSLALAGPVVGVVLLALLLAEGRNALHAAGVVGQMVWVGVLPLILWAVWRYRARGLPPAFMILAAYSVTVNLRFFLLGDFAPAAAGTTALALVLLVQGGIWRPPSRAGWFVLAPLVLLLALEPEMRTWRRPGSLHPVATVLGEVRLPRREATRVVTMRDALAGAPRGGLFVAGGGPGWYLVIPRRNPTFFDALHYGLGTTEPEAGRIMKELRSDPPAVVMFERGFRLPAVLDPARIENAVGGFAEVEVLTPDGRWEARTQIPPF
jgi:hypothetical protein